MSKNLETSKIATCVETDTNVRKHEVTERWTPSRRDTYLMTLEKTRHQQEEERQGERGRAAALLRCEVPTAQRAAGQR